MQDRTKFYNVSTAQCNNVKFLLERLDAVKNSQNWKWEEVGNALELSVSMLMAVRNGQRKMSDRSAARLERLEKSLGIQVESCDGPTVWNVQPHVEPGVGVASTATYRDTTLRLVTLTTDQLSRLLEESVKEQAAAAAERKLELLEAIQVLGRELERRTRDGA